MAHVNPGIQLRHYKIVDTQTGRDTGKRYQNRKLARRVADKLDLEYGAVRYSVHLA